ncbi:hypothetical protein Ndes2526B_g05507 [Nannochloris sp. 'desiccata']|nr:hypothetical protein NADE_005445 [Chlorella desiccata (nom. nud.)]
MRVLPLLLALWLATASGTGAGATYQKQQQGKQDVSELLTSDLGNHGRGLKQFGFLNGGTNIIDFLFGNNGGGQPTQSIPPTPPPPPPLQQPPPQQQTTPPPPAPNEQQQQAPPPQVETSIDPTFTNIPPNENEIVELLAAEVSLPAPEQEQSISTFIVTDGASSTPPSPPPSISPPSPPSPLPSSSSTVQLTGPRFTPAPAVYTPTTLPTYPPLGQANGPLNPSALSSVFPTPQEECKTLGEVLAAIPEASQWLDLITRVGGNVLLNDRSTRATLLVPINSAFSAGIDAEPLRPEKTMQALISNAPDIVNPLVGYSILTGLWPSATFIGGAVVPTANTVDKVNPLTIQAQSQTQLQGIGNGATILQADIAACGPSVVHIIDQILLPFRFDQGPTDAITGTQVQQGQNGYAAAGK